MLFKVDLIIENVPPPNAPKFWQGWYNLVLENSQKIQVYEMRDLSLWLRQTQYTPYTPPME